MIRVLIVDDQGLVRAGFRALLDAENDIEVVGEAAESVAEPGAQAGEAGQGEAGVHQVAGRPVDVGLRDKAKEEGQAVDVAGQVWKDVGDPAPAPAMTEEVEGAGQDGAGRRGDGLDADAGAGVELLAVLLRQQRLVVERVHLAGAAVHE